QTTRERVQTAAESLGFYGVGAIRNRLATSRTRYRFGFLLRSQMNCTQGISSAVALVGIAMFHPAQAHSWYSTTKDPMTGYRCCGGSDCAPIPESWVRYEHDGFRLRLTVGQAL